MSKLKLLSLFLFTFLLSLLGFVYATGDMITEEVPLPANTQSSIVDGKYGIFFCNDKENPKRELQILTVPGQKNEVCLYFVNDANTGVQLQVGIVDGTEKLAESGYARDVSCGNVEGNNRITNFIVSDSGSTSGGLIVDIPPRTRIMKEFYVTFPLGTEGQKLSCMVYSLVGNEKKAGNMFTFKFRTASYIDFFISSKDFNLGNKLSIQDLSLSVTPENKLVVNGFLANDGALNEIVSLTGTITNYFGFDRTFVLSGLQVKVGSKTKFSTEALIMDMYVPTLKGLFTVNVKAHYQPYFDFSISNMNIDKKVLEGGILTASDSLLLMPWALFGGFIIFLFLLYMAFFRRRKRGE